MGSKGRLPPPSHLRQPFPGPDMLHPDPFGPGVRPPPGAFPFDMLPPPEILERKFADQDVEMQRLLIENQRFAATHSVLRQELADAQHELQRLHNHMGAMKADQEQHMRGLLDKMAKMEAELKGSETLQVEYQQAQSEAQSLLVDRQELMSKVQQLTQDIQKKNHGDVQQVPAMMSELGSLRKEYQHCRATYDYERKLRIDHYESLQVMEKNYLSMVREVEKLRAELTNSSNVDKSVGSYSNSGGYKENDAAGQRSAGQNSYDVYGAPQGRGLFGGNAATSHGGGPVEATHTHPGYDAAVARGGPVYDASRKSSYDASRVAAAGYNNSKSASPGNEAPRGGDPRYDAANEGAGGAGQAPPTAENAAALYGSTQTASTYGSSQAQAPASYGSAKGPSPYGLAQASNPYGLAQASNPYGSLQAPNPYGSAQAQNSYGSAQALNPYGSTQAPPNPYGTTQAPNVARTGYDVPTRGGATRR